MEAVGYLGDAQFGSSQQEGGFHKKHLIDVINYCATCYLTYDTREINGRNVELGGVERDVVVFGKVVWQKTDETDKDLLNSLWRLAMYDGTALGIL